MKAGASSAVAAGEGLVGVCSRRCTVLPPLSFFHEGGPVGVFEGGDGTAVDGVPPGFAVCGKCRPLAMVDVTGIEGLLETVLVAFLWCPSVTMASGKFTIQGNL